MATIADGKTTMALAAFDSKAELKPNRIGRPAPGPDDVHIDVQYCGMCHSDLHTCDGSWSVNKYPISPGHEIAGVVRAVGPRVDGIKVGDRVGVGCMVLSCFECDLCKQGLEQHCRNMTQTYSSAFPAGRDHDECKGHWTNGGYTSDIVVHSRFVFPVPDGLELPYVAPLLCAGATMYSPLARHALGRKDVHVGIVGFGGLGHVGVKLAKAMGARVTVISRSLGKKDAAAALGAEMLAHTDGEAVAAAARTFDCILDTVSVPHPVRPLLSMLKVGGSLVLIGGVPQPFEISSFELLMNRHCVEGSLIAGVPETHEMLKFCADHKVLPDIDVIHARDASAHFAAMGAGETGARRAVIDMGTLKELF